MKRADWIDSCRFFAIFVIMVTHFFAKVSPGLLLLWETPPSSWLLYGLTGKFSVAFFFVLLGFFASRPSKFRPGGFISYILHRYFQFAFYIFICSFVYLAGSYGCTWLFHTPDETVHRVLSDGFTYNIIYALRESFLFEDNYNATLWCMQQLFLASIICKALGYIPERLGPLLRILAAVSAGAVLMLINAEFSVWLCAALLGYILRILLQHMDEHPDHFNKFCMFAAFAAALYLIKLRLPEGVLQYSLQSAAAFLLILVQFRLPAVQRVLAAKPFPWLGGISMGLFVTHTPVYSLLYSSLYMLLRSFLSDTLAQFIYFAVSVAVCIFCSWILRRAFEMLTKLLSRESLSV